MSDHEYLEHLIAIHGHERGAAEYDRAQRERTEMLVRDALVLARDKHAAPGDRLRAVSWLFRNGYGEA